MTEAQLTTTDQPDRLSDFLKDAHTATLSSVQIYGWWEMYDIDEIRSVIMGEFDELQRAFAVVDYHSRHGVISEAMDCIVVLSKAILRLTDMAERGEI